MSVFTKGKVDWGYCQGMVKCYNHNTSWAVGEDPCCWGCFKHQPVDTLSVMRAVTSHHVGDPAPASQKHLDKVDVTHAFKTTGKLPVGIKWNPEEWRVPVDYKRRLRLVFAGYVRQATSVKSYPDVLGDGFTLKPGKNDLVRELWWNHFHVGELIENPNGQGLPFDGPGFPPPSDQKLLPAPKKPPASQEQELPNFGWDPHGDD